MATICNLIPLTAKGEESKLYKELLNYTSNNRKLCNFLYASSIQEAFIKSCKPSEMNSQREPSLKKVVEAFNVDTLLNDTDLIEKAHAELGTAVSGTPIEFDNINDILDDVINFNERPNNPLRAVIHYKEGRYTVDIDILNDSNFTVGTRYTVGKVQTQILKDYFKDMGLNVNDWAVLTDRALNAYNASFFVNNTWLKFRNLNASNIKINIEQASLLLDLFKDADQVKRLVDNFGDEAPAALEYLYNKDPSKALPSELEPYSDLLTGPGSLTFTRIVDNFANLVHRKFAKVDYNKVEDSLYKQYKETLSEEDSAVLATLKTLYKKFHLDKDTIAVDAKRVSNTQELNTAILVQMQNTLQVLKKRELLSPEAESELVTKIRELEEKIEKKEYALSINQFMSEVVEVLSDTIEIQKDQDLSMTELNDLASLFLQLEEKIQAYLPIIKQLQDKQLLMDELEPGDIENIITEAKRLEAHLHSLENSLQEKKFAFAYNYIHRFWGEDSHYVGMGQVDRILEDCMKCGNVDMNIFDRYVLAASEVHDSVLSTVAESIKGMHEIRDEEMRKIDYDIRVATDKLFQSGSDFSFMFETNTKGESLIVSEIDWDSYYAERRAKKEELEAKGFKPKSIKKALALWDTKHTGGYELKLKNGKIIKLSGVPINRKALPHMTEAQREYYETMLYMKYEMEQQLEEHGIKTYLFRPPQIPKSMEEAVSNMTPAEVFQALKNKYLDWKVQGSEYGVIQTTVNAKGEEVNAIPVFYIDKLEDQTQVSKNFSKAMTAFMSMGINHNLVAERASILEVTKAFLMDREVETSVAGKPIVQTVEALGMRMNTTAKVKSSETAIKGWVQDLYEANLYGKRHKMSDYGEKTELAIKTAIQYTSVTGLAMNLPGAIANVLVGKLQMIIEAGGNEFANFKDYGVAESQYWKMLPELLGELYSNNKKSKLALLLDKFDAMDDFYDKLKESGFYKSPLSKILGNTSLFLMYGMGEHLLHAQNVLAVLNHIKVKSPEGKMVTLFDAFEVRKEGNNGILELKEGYTYSYQEDTNAPIEWRTVDESFVQRAKKKAAYVNRSCNGAFGSDEKGAIHRYAIGRLIMNFRQWMPAHYARRFNTLHWDADLEDYREGYYITMGKFAKALYRDMQNKEFQIKTRWNQLTPMERANLQRALTESAILVTLIVLSRIGLGHDPKHRSWFEAMCMYQIQRCKLETGASTPLYAAGFLKNIFTIVNSPAASINTVQKLAPLLNIDELILGEKYESGTHAGEYKYLHRVERAIPFYSQVFKWWNMDIDDSIFSTFKD